VHAVDDFVNGAVASEHENEIGSIADSFGGEIGGMAGAVGGEEARVQTRAAEGGNGTL
jgi:hypothetical protein